MQNYHLHRRIHYHSLLKITIFIVIFITIPSAKLSSSSSYSLPFPPQNYHLHRRIHYHSLLKIIIIIISGSSRKVRNERLARSTAENLLLFQVLFVQQYIFKLGWMMVVHGHILLHDQPKLFVGVTQGPCASKRSRNATCKFFIVLGLTVCFHCRHSLYVGQSVSVCV